MCLSIASSCSDFVNLEICRSNSILRALVVTSSILRFAGLTRYFEGAHRGRACMLASSASIINKSRKKTKEMSFSIHYSNILH